MNPMHSKQKCRGSVKEVEDLSASVGLERGLLGESSHHIRILLMSILIRLFPELSRGCNWPSKDCPASLCLQ